MGGPSGPDASISRRSWDQSRVAEYHPGTPFDVPSPRPRQCARVWSFRHAVSLRSPRGGVLGSTRPAPVRCHPHGPAQPEACPRPRQRGHHPGACPRRAEVEAGAQRGSLRPSGRTKFQVVALLVREERARVKADETISDAQRTEQLKRLDGSRRSSRRLPPGTPHCWLCSPKTLSSPRRPCRSSATWCWRPVWSRPPKRSPPSP